MNIFHIGDTNTYIVCIIMAPFLEGTFEQFQGRNQTPGVFDYLVKIVMYALCSMNKTKGDTEQENTSIVLRRFMRPMHTHYFNIQK